MKKEKFSDRVLPLILFLSFSGYYLLMIIILQLGMATNTRLMTVPARLLPLVFALYYIHNNHIYFFNNKSISILWLWLMIFYLLRMFYDLNFEDFKFFLNDSNYFMYTFVCFIVPPIFLSINFSDRAWNRAKYWVLTASIAVSLLGLFLYSDVVSEFGRIRGITDEFTTISPLAISYTSLIALGYFLTKLLSKQKLKKTIYYIVGICLSIPGIFLGSSRGSILALIFILIMMSIAKGKKLGLLVILGIFIIISPLILSLTQDFGSSLVDRVSNTFNETRSGDYLETDRPFLWRTAINNFLSNPIIGDLIENRGIGHHPHNIIIEAFMAMGLLGGIPFIIVILYLWKLFLKIARMTERFDWILVIFALSFAQNMVTGAIWGAIWLWTAAGSLISIYNKLKIEQFTKIN